MLANINFSTARFEITTASTSLCRNLVMMAKVADTVKILHTLLNDVLVCDPRLSANIVHCGVYAAFCWGAIAENMAFNPKAVEQFERNGLLKPNGTWNATVVTKIQQYPIKYFMNFCQATHQATDN